MTLHEPTFPPLLEGRAVVKGDDPLSLAIAGVSKGELGAGDTLWLQDTAQAELAIVLEPDDALVKAAQMLPLGVAAAGDCLATLTPPQVAVNFRWPGTILLNGADVGQCTLTLPRDCNADAVPPWMVLGLSMRFAFEADYEPGTVPGQTSLTEEGVEELGTIDVLESYSKHFLSLLDTWHNDGFSDIAENWAGRLEGLDEPVSLSTPGSTVEANTIGLDEDGNLLAKPLDGGHAIALPLVECLKRADDDGRA